NHQVVHFCAHKTAVGIFNGADDGFSSDVEGSVNKDSTARLFLKFLKELMEPRVCLLMHGLDASGIVHMSDRGKTGAGNIKLFNAKEFFLLRSHGNAQVTFH